jgi:hypothetical protein
LEYEGPGTEWFARAGALNACFPPPSGSTHVSKNRRRRSRRQVRRPTPPSSTPPIAPNRAVDLAAAPVTPPAPVLESLPAFSATERRKPQAWSASTSFEGKLELSAKAQKVDAVWSKHGPRTGKNWSKRQLAQIAIHNLHPDGIPASINQTQLGKDVNSWLLANHPGFAAGCGEIDRVTILRAAGLLKRR